MLGMECSQLCTVLAKEIEEPLIANGFVCRNPAIKISHRLLDLPLFDAMFVLFGKLWRPEALKSSEYCHLALGRGYFKVGPGP